MQNPIEQLKKEHEVFLKLLARFGELTENTLELDLDELSSVFNKLYTLWGVHEKKEEKLFVQMKDEEIKNYTEQMINEHKSFHPHKDALKKAIDSLDPQAISVSLKEHRNFILQHLSEHFEHEEAHLFPLSLEKYSDAEIFGMMGG